MKIKLFRILAILSEAITIFIACIFTNRLRMNYNSEGNYFDETEGVNYHKQALMVYGIILMVFLLLTMFLIRRSRK